MRIVGSVLVGDEEHARGHARARHDRSVVTGAACHRQVRNVVILRGLDESIEEGFVGACSLAHDDVVESELHAALFFDGGRLLEKEVVEGADMTPQVKTRSLPSWSQASQCLFIT